MAAGFIHEATRHREGFVFLRCFGYNNVDHVWYFFGFMAPGAYSSDKNPAIMCLIFCHESNDWSP